MQRLTSVTIPESVTSIGCSAFSGCKGLTSVTLPESVTSIGYSAFSGCKGLTSVTIPDGVTSIGEATFLGCWNLASVLIPNSVTSIGRSAFSGCKGLTSVTLSESVTSIGPKAFEHCSGLTSVTLPESVTNIGDYAFWNCSGLTSVTIPESVTSIDDGTFKECSSLTNVTNPANVMSIGAGAFDHCNSLRSVTIPESVTSIDSGAFSDCRGLTSVTIPESVTSIGNLAFKGCSGLMSITLPDSVTSIGDEAFNGCKRLKTVRMPDNESLSIAFGAFKGCENLSEFRISDRARKHLSEAEEPIPIEFTLMSFTTEEYASLYINQKKKWQAHISQLITDKRVLADEFVTCIVAYVEKMPEKRRSQAAKILLELLLSKVYLISEESKNLLTAEITKSNLKLAQKNGLVEASKGVEKEAEKDEVLEYAMQHSRSKAGDRADLAAEATSVHYADSKKRAPKPVIATLLAEYLIIWDKAKTWVTGAMGGRYDYAASSVRYFETSEVADTIASKLDRNELSKYLLKLTHSTNYRHWLLAFMRYATEEDMMTFLDSLRTKPAKEKIKKDNAAYTVCMSDLRCAAVFAEKNGTLQSYAEFRGTDADTIRSTVILDLGLDKEGKKQYDLGSTTLTVTLQKDLKFSMFDENNGKTVKSIPKRGNDEAKVKAASEDYSALKANVKEIVRLRQKALFELFLSGDTMTAEKWRATYDANPVMRVIAGLIVWQQGKDAFALKDKETVCADGTAYTLTDEPIRVAHPIEMKPDEVKAWQKYLTANGLKQLFAQMWERAIDPASVKADRYKGCTVPVNFFRGAEKHGLVFHDEHFHNEVYFAVNVPGCELEGERTTWYRYDLLPDETFTLGEFKFRKYTRRVNHLVTVLDRWTVFDRIKKDDVSVRELLDNFTLAQIMEFIAAAQENKAVNVTAMLLNYKNEHFEDFDPMEEFTLE